MIEWDFRPFNEVMDEVIPYTRAQSDEVYGNDYGGPVDPDWDKYRQYGEAGLSRVVTLRKDGKLIGYSVFFIFEHPHHPSVTHAVSDALYLSPEYRKGRLGIELIKRGEKYLFDKGIKRIMYSERMPTVKKILKYLGYNEHEVVYMKENK